MNVSSVVPNKNSTSGNVTAKDIGILALIAGIDPRGRDGPFLCQSLLSEKPNLRARPRGCLSGLAEGHLGDKVLAGRGYRPRMALVAGASLRAEGIFRCRIDFR